MAMNYEEALAAWGRKHLHRQALIEAEWINRFADGHRFRYLESSKAGPGKALAEIEASPEFQPIAEMIATGSVSVTADFDRGYGCCGREAESPYAEIAVSGSGYRVTFDVEDFDIAKFIGEVVEAGGGTITKA